jgi:serine/threonine protein kinase/Tfp pilus assembly protein PilF
MSNQMVKEGALFGSKYRIKGEIGRGGMGIVFKAEDVKLKRPVALKFLPPELIHSQEARERFVREAQSAAALDHPNICTVYEVDEQAGQAFIAMAYITGQTLKEKIAQQQVAIDDVLDIGIQVAGGLEEAHRKGIIHRDIKPANVMLTDDGQAKIMDFGLARLESAGGLTRTSAVMGTVAYMSPEQAQGEHIDLRSDIWSFGCLLYELLTGRTPFQGKHEQAVFHAILHGSPQPLVPLRKDIPVKLEKILGKCLQKDPANRYSNVESLIEDLRGVELHDIAYSSTWTTQKHTPSIAVLPFSDMSPDKDQDYFAESIAEELIHALSRIQGLHVVSRTSAFALKAMNLDIRDIGQKLNVKTILEGSIRKANSRLRITAQLINVDDGYQLWSERFDRNAEDIFAIQDEISLSIVESLKVTLRVGEKTALKKRSTDDPEAYNHYLKGLYFAARPDEESCNKALGFFREALDKDPNFASAYAGMGRVFSNLGIMNLAPPAQVLPQAKAALEKALDLDKDLAEAHAQIASIAFWFEWDWETAEKSFDQVLSLNPGDAFSHGNYAWFMLSQKRFDETIHEIKKALALDPLMPLYYVWSVGLHTATRRFEEALKEFTKAKQIDPKLGLAYFHAGSAYFYMGDYDMAVEHLQESREFGVYPGWAEIFMSFTYLRKGEKEKAARLFQEQLEEADKTTPSYTSLAWLAGAFGDLELAFELFDKAYEAKEILMPFINVYTEYLAPSLRTDPRFSDLLAKMNLVD